jgi:hypothetical protein
MRASPGPATLANHQATAEEVLEDRLPAIGATPAGPAQSSA